MENKVPTRKILKSMPHRKWDETSEYKEILLIPTGLKHDSGWMSIAIVGLKQDGTYEVAAYPDDIIWDYTEYEQKYDCTGMRTDCYYPQGVLRFHGRAAYIVEDALSSTTIKLKNIPK